MFLASMICAKKGREGGEGVTETATLVSRRMFWETKRTKGLMSLGIEKASQWVS